MKDFKFYQVAGFLVYICMLTSGCKKEDYDSMPTVMDIDGNTYHTVTIGTQVWMLENLKVTHFRNGRSIANVNDTIEWNMTSTAAYCDYLSSSINFSSYGCLYNWYAVSDTAGLAPLGWHIPSNADWLTLETYLGGNSVAGGKLKEAGYTHWENPNIGADNQSGFTGLPGGFRSSDGYFGYIQEYGYWWTSDSINSTGAWYRGLTFEDPYLYKSAFYKTYGLSVRCLKNQ